MMKIMGLVGSKKTSELSMQQLSKKAGMKLQPFYALVMNNIYKNPKALQKKLMIQKAEKLLVTSSMDIADIAKACNFSSPNYFIATFYREHHLLPEEFRSTSR
jgi:AraC-like DNA-binding protein